MRKAIALFLVFVISWNVGQEAVFLLWYKVANGSFTERFCINVEQPELMCHGKCQITRLTQEKKEEPQPQMPNLAPRFSYIALLPGHFLPGSPLDAKTSSTFFFLWGYVFLPIVSLFRPPPATALV